MLLQLNLFTLVLMIFLHVIADYLVQNDFLARFKQKKNWEDYVKENKNYKYDYLVVLSSHAFSWAFITFFPLYLAMNQTNKGLIFSAIVLINTLIHGFIDDQKCNKFRINLVQDQICHIIQISLTFTICCFV